jgi:hypothetical protein
MRLTHIAVFIAVVMAVSLTRSSTTETATSINLRDAAIPEDALKQLSAKRYATDISTLRNIEFAVRCLETKTTGS